MCPNKPSRACLTFSRSTALAACLATQQASAVQTQNRHVHGTASLLA